jgi:predicted dehydrogenase
MSIEPITPHVPKTIAILGAGQRGSMFASYMRDFAHLGKVVAVAEPKDDYRQAIIDQANVPANRVFNSWREFIAQPKMCDAVIIATMDRDHVEPAVRCMELGYDILLEKPMGVTLDECKAIEATQRKTGKILGVCHSMRYIKGFRQLKELIAAGAIGRIITYDQLEGVEIFHQAHSFVRGNWGNESRSTFMLLAKSCHDIDYISYVIDRPCISVNSYGALTYFRPEFAPPMSTQRCMDPCPVEPSCPFSALKRYVQTDRTQWPANTISLDHSYEGHLNAIKTGPYGRCVWKCDNDVVDHQVVAMQFADEITATFTMTGFTQRNGRQIRVHGTEGEIEFSENTIVIRTFADRNVTTIKVGAESGGHGGGDIRITREWLTALHTRDDSAIVANAQESLKSHSIVFAAEISRREGGRKVMLSELE